ncbi:MAG TPA: HEAT repeat domain-containing protein [Nitrospirota bacterium]|nr:HEAT repeat domain-containing protein [Nitrospirota bacterium]
MSDIQELGKRLESRNAEIRREATIGLGQLGTAAIPLLFRAIADADWRVRKTAVETLVRMRSDDIVCRLVQTLNIDDNAGARNSAIEALIQIGRPVIDALLPMLQVPNADIRKFTVDILGEIRDPCVVPMLITRLEDDDENICIASAEALGKIRDPRAINALVSCLNHSEHDWIAHAAAQALGEIGDERAVKPLLKSLNRSNLREPVIESLGKVGNVKTLNPLISGLTDRLRIVREVSIVALAEIERKSLQSERQIIVQTVRDSISKEAVALLEEMVATSTGDLQKATILLLGWAGRERSLHKVLPLLLEEELEEPIARSLQHLSKDKAPMLIDYLSSENALVRRTVARVLGDIGDHRAEEPLISLLSDENGHVRSTAALALSCLGSKKAIKPLFTLLTDEYVSVQDTAIQALAVIGDEQMINELIGKFSTRNSLLRRNIALLLGKFKTENAAATLAFALKDEESDVRKAVVQALRNKPPAQSIKSLLLAIADDDPEVRMLAADALGKIKVPETLTALVSLLEDKDLWVRAAAARSLGKIGGEQIGMILMSYLGTASDIFLLALVEALGSLKYGAAQEPLVSLTDHPDPEVRKIVLIALASYSGETVRRAAIAKLSDTHWSVRKAAIEVLQHGRDAAVESLLETIARSDSDMTVRKAAKEAMTR